MNCYWKCQDHTEHPNGTDGTQNSPTCCFRLQWTHNCSPDEKIYEIDIINSMSYCNSNFGFSFVFFHLSIWFSGKHNIKRKKLVSFKSSLKFAFAQTLH